MIKIIAEIGWNFMGDMEIADKMIGSAKRAGANIVKFQYWNPKRLKSGAWDTDGRRQIYESAQLTKEKIDKLIDFCKKENVQFLISVFNVVDAQFIKSLGIKSIKIPSHEVANFELHRYAVEHFEEIFVSLGAGSEEEIIQATKIYKKHGEGKFVVGMHCVSSYPCPASKANLPRMHFLTEKCQRIGYSDHTSDVVTPAVAVACGAVVIEKHFTIDKNLPGRDNKFALDELEFSQMVRNIRIAEEALLSHGDGPMDIENDTMKSYRGRWGDNV